MVEPTLLEPLGISAFTTIAFVVGHAVWSFAVPIALVESLRPELRHHAWLRRSGLVVTTLLYLAAAALIYVDHQQNEVEHASTAQLVGAALVIAVLVVVALTLGRRPPLPRGAAAPPPLVVGAGALLAGLGFHLLPVQWSGLAAGVAILAAVTWWVTRAGRSAGWGGQHVVALATGALAARALVAFWTVPLGDVPAPAKYAHNAAFLVGAIALGAWAARRVSQHPSREAVRGHSY